MRMVLMAEMARDRAEDFHIALVRAEALIPTAGLVAVEVKERVASAQWAQVVVAQVQQ